MLKPLNKNDTLNTPFAATKEWHVSNILNDDLIIYEHTGSVGTELEIALEFLDYGDGSTKPFFNSSCSIAKENQSDNLIKYREGVKGSGLFYPDSEVQNQDSTYKRLVYQQVQGMFYNNYRDPTKMWGMEEIDFDKSQTKKFLQDKFVLFDVPTTIMGEKVLPNTVTFLDNSSDNEYSIVDDGHCNLLVGTDVFSKQQELRDFGNNFESGSDGYCDPYFNFDPPDGNLTLTASQVDTLAIAQLDWTYDENDADGFYFERSVDSGSTWPYSFTVVGGSVRQTFDNTVAYKNTYWYRTRAYNTYGSSSWSNTASVYIQCLYLIDDPHDTSGDISSSVSFSVVVGGLAPFWYQWESGSTLLSDTTRITGSNTASLYINELHLSDSGSYRVYISNSCGVLTSSYAELHVNLYPPVVSDPEDVTVDLTEGLPTITDPIDQFTYVNGTASFTVSASGDLPIDIYWQSGSTWLVDTTRITGSQSASIQINNIQASDSGSYRALASNAIGYVYSNYANLIIVDLWGEPWEYPTGSIETSSNLSLAFGTEGTIRPAKRGIIASENINAYTVGASPSLNAGAGWDGVGVIS